jgi:uncharacterized protein (DUF2147 family)
MRLSTLPVIGVTAFLGAVPACSLGAQDVYGTWRHPDNGSLIQIYPCDSAICAKVVSVDDPNRKDVNNPDPALRDRPIVGIVIWRHARETARLQWSGSSYSPLDGATHYGTLHLTGDTTLVVASCNLSVMPCFERTWTKVSNETAPAISTLVSQPQVDQAQVSEPEKAPAVETQIVAKPKLPLAKKARKPRERTKSRVSRPSGQHGYNDLPHIHINR